MQPQTSPLLVVFFPTFSLILGCSYAPRGRGKHGLGVNEEIRPVGVEGLEYPDPKLIWLTDFRPSLVVAGFRC